MKTERRAAGELRAAGRRLEGHAAVWNTPADIGGAFRERIAPGAFRRSLASGRDVLALIDHDPNRLLGRTKTGTLKLHEDGRGLAYSIDLPSTTLADDLLALVQRGDVGGMSFTFLTPKGGDRWEGRSRTLVDVVLIEISAIHSFPAYPATTIAARAALEPAVALRLARLRVEFT